MIFIHYIHYIHYIILYIIIIYIIILYYIILCYVMLCYVMLYYIILYYIKLYIYYILYIYVADHSSGRLRSIRVLHMIAQIALKIAWQWCDSVILPILSIARREVVEGCIERLCKLCWAEAIEERIHRMHRRGPLSETRFFSPIYSTINSDLKRLYAVYIICHSKMLRLLPSASGQTASPRLM